LLHLLFGILFINFCIAGFNGSKIINVAMTLLPEYDDNLSRKVQNKLKT
jgi:hypothetical protein